MATSINHSYSGCDEDTEDIKDVCAFCVEQATCSHQPAQHFCYDCGPCGRYICGVCVKHHNLFLKRHRVIRTSEVQTSSRRNVTDMSAACQLQSANLQTKLGEKEQEMQKITEQLLAKDKTIKELTEELQKKTQRYDELSATVHNDEVGGAVMSVDTANRQNTVSDNLDAFARPDHDVDMTSVANMTEFDALKLSLDDKYSALQQCQEQLKEKNRELEQTNSELEELKRSSAAKMTEFDALKSSLCDKDSALKQCQEQLKLKEKELEQRNNELEELKRTSVANMTEFYAWKSSLDDKVSALEQCQKQLKLKERELEQTNSALEELKRKSVANMSEFEALRSAFDDQVSALEQCQGQLNLRESELEQSYRKQEELKRSINANKMELEVLKLKLDDNILEQVNKQLNQKQRELEQSNKELAAHKSSEEDLRKECEALKSEFDGKVTSLRQVQNVLKQKERELDQTKKQLKKLKNRNATDETAADQMSKATLRINLNEKEQISEQLLTRDEQNKELTKELEKMTQSSHELSATMQCDDVGVPGMSAAFVDLQNTVSDDVNAFARPDHHVEIYHELSATMQCDEVGVPGMSVDFVDVNAFARPDHHVEMYDEARTPQTGTWQPIDPDAGLGDIESEHQCNSGPQLRVYGKARTHHTEAWQNVKSATIPGNRVSEQQCSFLLKHPRMCSRLVVAAIVINTTKSYCPFSFRPDFQADPLRIHLSQSHPSCSFYSTTVPSTALFDSNKQFDTYGYEAEVKYAELKAEDEHHEWYYFKTFASEVYGKKNERDFDVTDVRGIKMKAVDVYSAALRYMREDLMNNWHKCSFYINNDDVHYVIPVPSTCTDSALDIINKAAVKSGISRAQFSVVFEPEAVTVYYQTLLQHRPDRISNPGLRLDTPGTKWIVLNLDETLANITVLERQKDSSILELHKETSNALGGNHMYEAFYELFEQVFGRVVFQKFVADYTEDFEDLKIEILKVLRSRKKNRFVFRFPNSILGLYREETKSAIKPSHTLPQYAESIELFSDKMIINAYDLKNLLKPFSEKILDRVDEILRIPGIRDTKIILMVGEFSELLLIQEAIRNTFFKMQVFCFQSYSHAVGQGTVILGHCVGV